MMLLYPWDEEFAGQRRSWSLVPALRDFATPAGG